MDYMEEGVRINDEDEGFFSHCGGRVLKRFGVGTRPVLASVLVRWLDDWQAVLLLCTLLFFFGFALPMGIAFLGIWYGATYAYAWAFLWIGVSSLLAYREVIRRDKAIIGSEWTSNPNAINEYMELIKKKD